MEPTVPPDVWVRISLILSAALAAFSGVIHIARLIRAVLAEQDVLLLDRQHEQRRRAEVAAKELAVREADAALRAEIVAQRREREFAEKRRREAEIKALEELERIRQEIQKAGRSPA